MSDHTPDALASALPADDYGRLTPKDAKELAHIQAERLAESGYVLLHPEYVDEATIDRLAEAIHEQRHHRPGWGTPPTCWSCQNSAKASLAALAGTSAQARHTDGDATEGGEHG